MNVKTGAILAMTTQPDFDPNDPTTIADAATAAYVESLKDDEEAYNTAKQEAQFAQWRNKAISDAYEPGSVFKIVTGSMALELGVTTETGIYYTCTGSYTVAGREKSCWKTAGHGTIDFTHAVMYSCNPAFMMIGEAIGAESFQDYFERFGLRDATGIDLPGEAEGYFYSDLVAYDAQSAEYLASSSFGQTFTVTPIQMITAVSAAVNGGNLLEPYVVAQVLDSEGNVVSTTSPTVKRRVISEETSETMRRIMEQVVGTTDGSGKKAYVPGYRIGGKTGTSQKLAEASDSGETYIVSFVGVAPIDDPEIAVLVVLDEPIVANIYGSVIAAPVVGAIMSDILPYLGVEAVYTEEEAAVQEVTVPYVVGSLMHDAIYELTASQLSYKIVGDGVTVTRQLPAAGQECPKGTTVILYFDDASEDTTIPVPDVVGMSGQQANRTILNAGLNIRLAGDDIESGTAVAVSQDPEAGTEVESGTVVTVTFALTETP
jgi:stage V sporulation protein D (sporulation-specific penicillin-binding protein)